MDEGQGREDGGRFYKSEECGNKRAPAADLQGKGRGRGGGREGGREGGGRARTWRQTSQAPVLARVFM
jgi:hypothetical protein